MTTRVRRQLLATILAGESRVKEAASSVLPAQARELEYRRAILRAQLAYLDSAAQGPSNEGHALLNPDARVVRGMVHAARQGPETPYDAHLRLIGSDPNLGAIARSLTAPTVMFSDAYYGDSDEDQQDRQRILAILQALNGD